MLEETPPCFSERILCAAGARGEGEVVQAAEAEEKGDHTAWEVQSAVPHYNLFRHFNPIFPRHLFQLFVGLFPSQSGAIAGSSPTVVCILM